ncbi:BQ2448_5582 [Microbotryum intermedium]|uniref:BQ2448_5582 protein n=1 Tax=Microbotryum intermedium TaxID=269621 RepID=A0A238F762_9BASI|nr:BQ2448_5582 [Microbotryum intermedium]
MSWLQPAHHAPSGNTLDLVNRPTPLVDSLPEAPPPLPELLAGPPPPPAVRKREVGQLIVVVLRVWDEEFRFVVHAAETTKTPSEPLLVKIRDRSSGRGGDDQLVGQGQVSVVDSKTWVRNKDTGTYEFDDWVQLQKDRKFAGEVFLEMNSNSATVPSTRPASTAVASTTPTHLSSLQRQPSRLDPSTRLQPGYLVAHPVLQRPAGRFEPIPRPSKFSQQEPVQQTGAPQSITFNRPSNASEDAASAMTFSRAPGSGVIPARNNVPSSLTPGLGPQSHVASGPQVESYSQHPPTLVGQMSSLSISEQLPQQISASSSCRPLPSPPGATSFAYPDRQSYGSDAVGTEVGVNQPPHDRHPQLSPSLESRGKVVSDHIPQHPQSYAGLQHQMPQYQHAHQLQHQHQAQSQQFQQQLQQKQHDQQQQQLEPSQYRRAIQQQHQQLHREHLQHYQHMYQPSYTPSDHPEHAHSDPQSTRWMSDASPTHRNSDANSPFYFASSSRLNSAQFRASPSPIPSPGSSSTEPPPRPPKTPYNAPSPAASASPVASPELVVAPPRHGSLPLDSSSTSTSRMSSLDLNTNAGASPTKPKDKGKQKAEPVPSPSPPSPSPSLPTITKSLNLPSSSTASTSSATGSSASPSTSKSRTIDPVMLAEQARSLFRFQQEQEDARLAALLAEEARVAQDQVRKEKAIEDEEVVRKMLEEEEKMRVQEEKRNELMAREWEERERMEKEERERKDEELAFKLGSGGSWED